MARAPKPDSTKSQRATDFQRLPELHAIDARLVCNLVELIDRACTELSWAHQQDRAKHYRLVTRKLLQRNTRETERAIAGGR